MTKEELNELLKELSRKASEKGGRITRDEVTGFFSGKGFSEEQLDLVCDFLLSRGIVVDGYIRKQKPAEAAEAAQQVQRWSDEEQRWLEHYLSDLGGIRPEQPGEWAALAGQLGGSGAPAAKRRIAEILLPDVLELVKEMYRPGVLLQDIIQEGSLQLVLAADELDADEAADREATKRGLMTKIREGVQTMLASQEEVHARDEKLVKKASDFRDGLEILKEEYGRRVYLDEAADFMNITEDEAEDILRLTGDQVPDDSGENNARQ